MSEPHQHVDRTRRQARVRGARHMVSQGLALYYQCLVHRVVDDTPSFFEHVMATGAKRSKAAGRAGAPRSAARA